MIPSLLKFYQFYDFFPKRLCGDAGYRSLKNYTFLLENNIENYIKFSDWARVVSVDTYDLFYFDQNENLICLNNKVALKTRFFDNRYAHKGSFLYVIQSCSYCRLKK